MMFSHDIKLPYSDAASRLRLRHATTISSFGLPSRASIGGVVALTEAANARRDAAIAKILQTNIQVDFLITDLGLPNNLNGLAIFAKLRRENVMPGQAARNPRDNEQRVARQIDKIKSLEDAGRLSDARRARETLATITETRDALRLRLKVENEVE